MRRRTIVVMASLGLAFFGCAKEPARPANVGGAYGPGQGQYPSGQYPPGQYPPGQYPPGQYPPGQPPPAGTVTPQPTPGVGSNLPPPQIGSFDAFGAITPEFMRVEAKVVLDELVAALSDTERAKVQGIPLAPIEDPKEVNAFAGCDKAGKAFMGITMPLLVISAASSEAKAFDELSGTRKLDEYGSRVAEMVRGGQAVRGLNPGELPLPSAVDPRKLSRQKFLFDEQVAFVLGHELAHHYRGHTGCANGGASTQVTSEDLGRLLSNAVPVFNQPMEVEADVNGTQNTLNAGARRQGGAWTEEGALMTLGFFNRLTGMGPEVLLLGILQSHPHPVVRIPIVQGTANQWRARGGSTGTQPSSPFPFPFPLPFPIPGLGN